MRNALLILPFLSILTAAVFTALASTFSQHAATLRIAGLSVSALLVALWVLLDINGFKTMFNRKGARYGASSGVIILLALGIFVGLGVITSRPRFDKSVDLSRDKTNTLSEQSVKAIESLGKAEGELSILAFFDDDAQEQAFRDLLRLYAARTNKIATKFVNPQKDPMLANAEKLTSANTAIFRLGGRENRITTFNEEKFTNALVAVLKEGSKKVYFTTGHGEGQLSGQDPSAFELVATELKNNRFDVAELNLLEVGKVPDDASVVVMSGLKYDLKEPEVKFLEDFITRGGALMTMIDAMTPVENVNKLLSKYGLKYNNDFMILRPDDPRVQFLGSNNAMVAEFDEFNIITKDFAKKNAVALLFQNTRTISEITDNAAKFKVSLVGKTAASTTVRVKDVTSQNDLKGVSPSRLEQGAFAVMATTTGKSAEKDVRIIAYGSAQIANNYGARSPENRDLVTNSISWLTQYDDFVAIRPRDVTKSTLTITSDAAQLNLKFISWFYPFLFLAFGTFYWLRRRQA
jgi:ABC-type uncharacterized transport system involved in gliding motility auxiliary subunit